MMASRKRENVEKYPVKRFRKSRSCEEEKEMLVNAVPLSTRIRACLYERRDGTFAGTGRWPGSRHAYVSIVFITYCLYGGGTFFVPSRLGGIPVSATGIPPRRDGTKNVPPPYKQYAIKTIETYTCRDPGHRPVSVNVPSRLSYKQALNVSSCPARDNCCFN